MLGLVLGTALVALGCGVPGSGKTSQPPTSPPDPENPLPETPEPETPEPEAPTGLQLWSVDPLEGRTAGGELAVLEGQGFVDGTKVYFGSLPAQEVTVYSPVVIHARTPAHKTGMVDVRLVTPTGEKTVLEDAFLFRDELKITSIEPDRGAAAGGTPITVRGVGFVHDTRVLLGGRLALDITVVDSSTILAIAPPGAPGPSTVLVSTPFTNDSIHHGFRFTAPPKINHLSPASGVVGAETTLTLVGAYLSAESKVWVGDLEAAIVGGNGLSTLKVVVQGGAEGAVDVRVETADGATVLNDAFTFTLAQPLAGVDVLNAWPHSGDVSGGEEVVITAYGPTTLADTTVRFGSLLASIVSVDAVTHRTVVLSPAGAAGDQVDITIETSLGAASLEGAYTYTTVPAIAAVSPNKGPVAGGTTLSIDGSNLAGDVDVFVGALPATILSQTDSSLEVATPPGSPGASSVRVISAGGEATATNAFTYLPTNGPEFYAVTPSYGAVAGNTLIHVYGAGFETGVRVRFAKKFVDVNLISSTELQVRAPKADEPVTLDITVEADAKVMTIKDAYSYFDPYSPYGGSWGPPVRGTVNITVLDIFTTDPIPDAFVMLWADPTTPFQGFTDDRGQITFSAPQLQGPQMVTASKAQHTAMSVVEYDAENVTVHLIPYNPPSTGGGGGGDLLPNGRVRGVVTGLGKYVKVPPQTCTEMATLGKVAPAGTTNCVSCAQDADCGAGAHCINVALEGMYCADGCTADFECPSGYRCLGASGGGLACQPDPGQKAAYCQTTSYELWEDVVEKEAFTPGAVWTTTWVQGDGSFVMDTRLGELAIVCVGGVVRDPNDKLNSFVPTALGVGRHIDPIPAEEIDGVVIDLSVRLEKDVPLRLDGAPTSYTLQDGSTTKTMSDVRVAFDFGAEGYWTVANLTGYALVEMTLKRQPKTLTGPLEGVSYTFRAEVFNGMYASSGTQAHKVKVLEVDRMFTFVDGAWQVLQAGIPTDVHAMWGDDPSHVWAVGAAGLIAHGKNGSWFPQASPVEAGLNAVWGVGQDFAIAAGEEGAIVRFDGATWDTEDSGTISPLYAAWGSAPDNMYAVGQGTVLHRGALGWSVLNSPPPTTLRAAWGPSPTELWAAGDDGKLWRLVDGVWSSTQLVQAASLRGMAGGAPGAETVWLVGDLGTVIEYSVADHTWVQHDVPTSEQLNAVHTFVDGTVFVVGRRGTLLRWDGYGWSLEQAPKYGGDLRAVWSLEGEEPSAVAAGTQVVSLGPMLSFPEIGDPIANTFGGSVFSYHLDWDALPGAEPTFNFVEMLSGPGWYFPAWWTVVEADVQDITFPNLMEIQGINPFPPGNLLMRVTRVLKPGASVHNFDFFDMYDAGGWQSWAMDGVEFSPF